MEKHNNFWLDKDINIKYDWYLHAINGNTDVIKKILEEGLKCQFLQGKKGSMFNGKYYISLYKPQEDNPISKVLIDMPKVIISGINPLPTYDLSNAYIYYFSNSIIPIRCSSWDGEYQQFWKIAPTKFVAMEFSLYHILHNESENFSKEKLEYLREIIKMLQAINNFLPIYDLSINKEINKERILKL